MRHVAVFAFVLLIVAMPLRAQDDERLESMLQYVIDLPEMEQVLGEFAIDEQLYVVRTPALPQELGLVKFGRAVEITTDEGAFFRNSGYLKFTTISATESPEVAIQTLVVGPDMEARDGADVSLLLKEQPEGWTLESFQRTE